MSPQPVQSRPIYLLALQPARGRDGIRGLPALLKTAWRRHGLRALEVRELRPDSKRAKRLPKFVSKTDEPPALSRRGMICIRKDPQMKKDDVFPAKYLKCPDLNGKPTTATVRTRRARDAEIAPRARRRTKSSFISRGRRSRCRST